MLTPEQYIQRLTELSGKKAVLLGEMLDLTKRQAEAIGSEDIESLQKLVDEKQKRIDAVNKLDDSFNMYFARLKQTTGISDIKELESGNAESLKKLKTCVEEIVFLLDRIRIIEGGNNEKALKLKEKFAGELKRLQQGKRMNSAYRPMPGKIPSYYIDRKE